jgi:transposase
MGMKTMRKRYSADFKAKVALEAIRGDLTLAELGAKHGIHHTMIAAWKLHSKIGQLVVERDFLAKAFGR